MAAKLSEIKAVPSAALRGATQVASENLRTLREVTKALSQAPTKNVTSAKRVAPQAANGSAKRAEKRA